MKHAMVGLLALAGSNAFGSLVLVAPAELSGTGFGTVTTVLTLQSPGSATLETGCVAPGASGPITTGCGFADSNVQSGQSHIGTPTLASAGIASAADLGVIFNASQQSGGAITIDNLVLNLYGSNSTKSTDFSSGAVTFDSTASGVGNSGFLFRLDGAQAAVAQAFIDANGGASEVSIGLGSSISNATGGPETFFVASAPAAGGSVPEPVTSAMLGSGLVAFGFLLKRRKSKA
jgi:hypothetical protein